MECFSLVGLSVRTAISPSKKLIVYGIAIISQMMMPAQKISQQSRILLSGMSMPNRGSGFQMTPDWPRFEHTQNTHRDCIN